MAKVGRFITDPKAGSSCQITLTNGATIVVNHNKWRLTIERLKLFGFSSETIFGCDLTSREALAAVARLVRDAHPGSMAATPLGAFVNYVKDCGSPEDVKARCDALLLHRVSRPPCDDDGHGVGPH